MGELETTGATGGVVATTGGVLVEAVRYGIVVAQLLAAGIKLSLLGDRVRSTYRYIERCSTSVDRLADQMAGLEVDSATVNEHRDAATVMRGVLNTADEMASATEDLSTLFGQAAAAHQADYGTVAETANAMPVPMADASFYSNR
jgi:hypothetical protein